MESIQRFWRHTAIGSPKNLDKLVKKHAGKYIAVYRNRLFVVGDSYRQVFAAAESQGLEEPPLTMQVPAMEDIRLSSDGGWAPKSLQLILFNRSSDRPCQVGRSWFATTTSV